MFSTLASHESRRMPRSLGRGLKRARRNMRRKFVAGQKARLRVEGVADLHVVDVEPILVSVVEKPPAVALFIAGAVERATARVVTRHFEILEERQAQVSASHDVRVVPRQRRGARRGDEPDAAAAQDVFLHPHYGKRRLRKLRRWNGVGADAQQAEVIGAHFAKQPAADLDRHRLPVVQPNPTAEEHDRGLRRGAIPRAATESLLRATEGEQALPFKKEFTLLWKEETEPREVELLLVDLHLREIGVVRDVGREALGQSVPQIEAEIPVEIGTKPGFGWDRVRIARDIRLHFEVQSCRRRLDADQHRSGGDPDDPIGPLARGIGMRYAISLFHQSFRASSRPHTCSRPCT